MATDLATRLAAASGADADLDAAIADVFRVASAPFTASVADCRRLVTEVAPDGRLHLGYGASGVFPYAALIRGADRATAEAPTVPLAILRALVASGRPEGPQGDTPTH